MSVVLFWIILDRLRLSNWGFRCRKESASRRLFSWFMLNPQTLFCGSFFFDTLLWPILNEFSRYSTRLHADLQCTYGRIAIYWKILLKKRDLRNGTQLSEFYHMYSGIQTAIWYNIKLEYRENSLRIGQNNVSKKKEPQKSVYGFNTNWEQRRLGVDSFR